MTDVFDHRVVCHLCDMQPKYLGRVCRWHVSVGLPLLPNSSQIGIYSFDCGMPKVFLLFVLILHFGCMNCAAQEVTSKPSRANWKANPKEFFTDPATQRVCDAISSHDMDQLKKLGVDVDLNTLGKSNMSLPFWAYLEGNKEALEFLLDKGASPDHRLSDDLRIRGGPIGGSTKHCNLIQHAFHNKEVRKAFFQLAVLHTNEPNQEVYPGFSLLHWYSSVGFSKSAIEDLMKLISKGADLDSKTAKGETACHLASDGCPSALLVLILAGADWKIPFQDGSMLIDVVRKKSHPNDNELHYQYLTVLYWLDLEVKKNDRAFGKANGQ